MWISQGSLGITTRPTNKNKNIHPSSTHSQNTCTCVHSLPPALRAGSFFQPVSFSSPGTRSLKRSHPITSSSFQDRHKLHASLYRETNVHEESDRVYLCKKWEHVYTRTGDKTWVKGTEGRCSQLLASKSAAQSQRDFAQCMNSSENNWKLRRMEKERAR